MKPVKSASVIRMSSTREREHKVSRALGARHRVEKAAGGRGQRRFYGRAWINGREIGGSDPRYEHLVSSYD
jgi:hypothetical protein